MTSQTARIRAQRRAEEQAARAATQPAPAAGPRHTMVRLVLDFAVEVDPPTDAEIGADLVALAARNPDLPPLPRELSAAWQTQQVLTAALQDPRLLEPLIAYGMAGVLDDAYDTWYDGWLAPTQSMEEARHALPEQAAARAWWEQLWATTNPRTGKPYDGYILANTREGLSVELVGAQLVSAYDWHRHAEQEAPAGDD